MERCPPLHAGAVAHQSGSGYPEPFNTSIGSSTWQALGAPFGLTQFGVNLEVLKPGDQSALRHWHTLSDEFVYVVSGTVTLVTDDGESPLTAGMCVGFRAGEPNGHHFINQSSGEVQLLVMGTRVPGDTAFYPDDDLLWLPTPERKVAVHRDGSPYPQPVR
jgi:uncharacterized cupin superfamily protein